MTKQEILRIVSVEPIDPYCVRGLGRRTYLVPARERRDGWSPEEAITANGVSIGDALLEHVHRVMRRVAAEYVLAHEPDAERPRYFTYDEALELLRTSGISDENGSFERRE